MCADSMLTGEDNSEFEADIEENWDKYIKLPSRFEIDEYNMMEEFIWGLPEGKNQDIDKWYAYRDAEYVKVAKEWCERHHIEWEEQE